MSDPFAEFAVDDPFAEFEAGTNRDSVVTDFTSTEQDVVEGGVKTIGDARKGRVASYIASDGSVDFDTAYQNIEQFGKELTGKSGDVNEVFQTIASETQIGTSEEELQSILNTPFVWGGEGPMPETTLTEEQRIQALETSEDFSKRSRGFEAFGRAITPDWAEDALGVRQPMPVFTKMDVAEDVVGEITGIVASFRAFSGLIQKAGGVNSIPKVNETLYKIGQTSPRLSRMTHRALNTFATLGLRSQFMSDSKSLKERAKMVGADALFAASFPVADEIAEISRLGKASIPAAATAMFAFGTTQGDTLEEKIVGGTSMAMMWGMSYGMNYQNSKDMVKGIAKGVGVQDPEAFVSSLSRAEIMRGAGKFRDMQYMNQFIVRTAEGAKAGAQAGRKLLPSEKLAVVKVNENALVKAARAGEIAPIKADRAVLQTKAVVKGLLEAPIEAPAVEAPTQEAPKDAPNVEKVNEPWQMTPDEFEKDYIFRGVTDENIETPNTFWGTLGVAKDYANSIGRTDRRLRIARKSDVHEDLLWLDDDPVSVDQILEKEGMIGTSNVALQPTPAYEILEEGIDNPHKYLVEKALHDGKPVPKHVLAIYPDISKPTPQEAPTQEAQTEDPVTTREQNELQVLRNAQTFGQPEQDVTQSLAEMPTDPEAHDYWYGETLPVLYNPPDVDPPNASDAELSAIDKGFEFMKEAVGNTARIFKRFGKQYVFDQQLGERYTGVYHEAATAAHRGAYYIHEQVKGLGRNPTKDLADISIAVEAKDRALIPSQLSEFYELASGLFSELEQMEITAGVLSQTFEEAQAFRIAELNDEIVKAKGATAEKLIAERDRIKEIKGYLPHTGVARAVIENKMRETRFKKIPFSKKLSQFHKERKGTYSLKEYRDMGLLTDDDLNITKLLMRAYADGYHKIAIKNFLDWAEMHGYVVPANQEVDFPENWIPIDDVHPVAKIAGLKDVKLDRIFAEGLEELAGAEGEKLGKLARAHLKTLGVVKVGQFVRPDVIFRHNFWQSIYGGTATANPYKLAKNIGRAAKIVASKDEMYRTADKYGLYQKTDLPTKATVDQMINQVGNKTKLYFQNEGASVAVNFLTSALGLQPEEAKKAIKDKDVARLMERAFMAMPGMVSGVTWAGDEFQRTVSWLNLMDRGIPPEEAALRAGQTHGAYGDVGVPYKNKMRWVAFVHSFRLLMPWEYQIKPWIQLAEAAYKKSTGKKFTEKDKRKARRAAWIIFATTGVHMALDVFMKKNGWDVDEKERNSGFRKWVDNLPLNFDVPIGDGKTTKILSQGWAPTWRYSKEIETPDGPKKITKVLNFPTMTFSRFGIRSTEAIPEEVGNEEMRGVFNALKAEMHPFYKITTALIDNEPIEFGGLPPRGVDGRDWVGGIAEAAKASVRLYGVLSKFQDEDIPQNKVDELISENTTILEKIFTFGSFAYISNTDEQKKAGKMFQAVKKAKDMGYKINRAKVSEEEKAKQLDALAEETIKAIERIESGE